MKPRQQTEDRPDQQTEAVYPVLNGFAEFEFSARQQGGDKDDCRADGDGNSGGHELLDEGVEPFHKYILSHALLFIRASIPALCFFAGYVLAAFQFFQPCGL